MGNIKVKEHSLLEKGNGKVKSMLGNTRMDFQMVKEQSLTQMGESMLVNTKMEKGMVKEHLLVLMEESMKGNTRMGNIKVKEH